MEGFTEGSGFNSYLGHKASGRVGWSRVQDFTFRFTWLDRFEDQGTYGFPNFSDTRIAVRLEVWGGQVFGVLKLGV